MAMNTNAKKTTKEKHKATRRSTTTQKPLQKSSEKDKHLQQQQQQQQLPSWAVMKKILTCKHLEVHQQQVKPRQQTPAQNKKHNKQKLFPEKPATVEGSNKKSKKMRCSGSLCNNTKVMHRPEPSSPEALQRKPRSTPTSAPTSNINERSNLSFKPPPIYSEINNNNNKHKNNNYNNNHSNNRVLQKSTTSSNNSNNYCVKGLPFSRFSGCYECRMIVDPVLAFTRDPSLRSSICSCPDCGEIFMKPENLELHQAVTHAVSELGPEDTSKNIVEIIFQSSWQMKKIPVCKIDRILKIHNTQRTINRFEEYRDFIKFKATKLPKKHPRCIADGNELLRFHCTTFKCSLGLNGSSNLCNSIPHCNICSVIKNGFKVSNNEGPLEKGILTTATSGRAHERAQSGSGEYEKRAMLVCRVIVGRVKKNIVEGGGLSSEEYDSVPGAIGVYSNLDELYVFNPKAILPCFVVIYRGS